jgi:hypothetical protein
MKTRFSRRSRSSFLKTPFMQKTRKQRCDKVIYIKEKIRRSSNIFGPLFTSHHIIENTERPPFMDGLVSVLFLSRDRSKFWNCTIRTASRVFWDETDVLARKRADDLIRASGYVAPEFKSFKEMFDDLIRGTRPTHDVLDGRTSQEYVRWLAPQIIKNEPLDVFEKVEIDYSYEYGCGLEVVLNTPAITLNVVNDFIRQFLESGEVAYTAEAPVPRDQLPTESFDEMMQKAMVPGYMIGNAIYDGKKRGVWKPGRKIGFVIGKKKR